MVKHKSVKEMMAERKPLLRKPVEPINIYSTPPASVMEQPKPQQESRVVSRPPKLTAKKETKTVPEASELLHHYSTYLRKGQVKGIKLRALERDINDMEIVQEAVDEYFKNHPL
jgi:hypothetical protein